MGCWRWFNAVIKEAGIAVSDQNREKVDEVIHQFIGERAEYEHCSSDWRSARKRVMDDPAQRQKLVTALKAAVK